MLKIKILMAAVLLAILGLSLNSCCHKPAEKVETLEITQKSKEVIGSTSWDRWQKRVPWDYSASDYYPDDNIINEIKGLLSAGKFSFMLFGGSWCEDSETEMPKIYKMFELAGYDTDKMELIGLDRNKNEPTNIGKMNNIEKVPTLLVFKDKKEIGRIVETPEKSWEEDLLQIIK